MGKTVIYSMWLGSFKLPFMSNLFNFLENNNKKLYHILTYILIMIPSLKNSRQSSLTSERLTDIALIITGIFRQV